MPSSAPEPHVVEDCRGVLQLMSDGTVRRSAVPALPVDVPDDEDCGVEWKDVTWDRQHDLNARLYRPGHLGAANDARIPVVAYFHGGGFCIGSGRWPNYHAWCLRLCSELPAVVLSFDYRLAPEHRLPAAQEDGARAMAWLTRSAATDPWLADAADFARAFVAGDSAGGNIAHHVAVRYGRGQLALDHNPVVRLAGCVLLWPYFAAEERTASETAGLDGHQFVSTKLLEQMWRMALPVGATRDHTAANPFGPDSDPLDDVAFPPVLVVDPDLDVLHDRIQDYAARLTAMAKPVELVVFRGKDHGFFTFDPCGEASDQLIHVIRGFVHGG